MNQNVTKSATTLVEQPEKSSPISNPLIGLAVAAVALLVIFWKLSDEPYFIDESAMIGQSYYYTLLKTGQWQHPDWLHYAAYDHPPLPKYFFGLSLDLAGLPVPATLERWMRWIGFEPALGGGWQKSPSGADFSPPGDPRVLFWARVPSSLFGAAGATAVFAIGLQIHSRLAGLIGAALLTLNPLYVAHARRAMSDSFAECLVAASVAVVLWGCTLTWNRDSRWWKWGVFVVSESVLCGLAALAKLNGGVASIIVLGVIGGTLVLAFLSPSRETKAPHTTMTHSIVPAVVAIAIGFGSFAVFVGLNPLMTARPALGTNAPTQTRELAAKNLLARAKFLVDFRREWTVEALKNPTFKTDWLRTFPERVRMTMWEGFGRFSPLGPRDIRTHEPRPDRERFTDYHRATSLLWLPLVAWGLVLTTCAGWHALRAGRPPVAWALVLYMAVSLAIVVFMIPLNWDRYYLPLQAPAAALAAIAIAATVKRVLLRELVKKKGAGRCKSPSLDIFSPTFS
jgi:Dolichyl-phosphate-mannose-protein mannosyltransferase